MGQIPACPKKRPGRQNADGTWTEIVGDGWCKDSDLGSSLHPGAHACYRSYGTGVVGGAQCCYNEKGDLITTGPGAGTPDLVGTAEGEEADGSCDLSLGRVIGHIVADVAPPYIIWCMHQTGPIWPWPKR